MRESNRKKKRRNGKRERSKKHTSPTTLSTELTTTSSTSSNFFFFLPLFFPGNPCPLPVSFPSSARFSTFGTPPHGAFSCLHLSRAESLALLLCLPSSIIASFVHTKQQNYLEICINNKTHFFSSSFFPPFFSSIKQLSGPRTELPESEKEMGQSIFLNKIRNPLTKMQKE